MSTPLLTPHLPQALKATIVPPVGILAFGSSIDLGDILRDRETVTPTTIPVRSW